MSAHTRNTLLLVLCALIWGTAFSAQSMGAGLGAFTFLACRSWLALAVLIPAVFFFDRYREKHGLPDERPITSSSRRLLLRGGVICGLFLFGASFAQQFAITLHASTAKAGFITAMYVVLVPLLGLLLGRKSSLQLWFCAAVSLLGLYLLCMSGGFEAVQASDLILLCCALLFAMQIMAVDRFSPRTDGVRLSLVQFCTTAVCSTIAALLLEHPSLSDILSNAGAIAYCGIFSSGIAYTLQILGQKDLDPTIASLAMCLESVFAALSGFLLLHQTLTLREAAGCALIFLAVVLSQIPVGRFRFHKPRT